MNPSLFFIVLALIFAAWAITTAILIYNALRTRNIKVSFLFLRLMIPWYAEKYKEVTLQETGRIGPLFYHWLISINAALFCFIAAFVVNFT